MWNSDQITCLTPQKMLLILTGKFLTNSEEGMLLQEPELNRLIDR